MRFCPGSAGMKVYIRIVHKCFFGLIKTREFKELSFGDAFALTYRGHGPDVLVFEAERPIEETYK